MLTGTTIMKPNNISFFFFWSDIKKNGTVVEYGWYLGKNFHVMKSDWPLNNSFESMHLSFRQLTWDESSVSLSVTSSYSSCSPLSSLGTCVNFLSACSYNTIESPPRTLKCQGTANKFCIRTKEARNSLTSPTSVIRVTPILYPLPQDFWDLQTRSLGPGLTPAAAPQICNKFKVTFWRFLFVVELELRTYKTSSTLIPKMPSNRNWTPDQVLIRIFSSFSPHKIRILVL